MSKSNSGSAERITAADSGRLRDLRIRVGSLVVAKLAGGGCDPGEVGVCYELYQLAGRPGYRFVFEGGRYDGFSPKDIEMLLDLTGRICESVADYQFRNVTQVSRDFQAGRFAAAFPAWRGRA